MRIAGFLLAVAMIPLLLSCGGKSALPPVADTVPLILAPVSKTKTADARGRFREIYCAVREDHGRMLPDDRPCEEALWRLAEEPEASGKPVFLGTPRMKLRILVVPGLFNDCLEHLVSAFSDALAHLESQGFKTGRIPVSGRSGCAYNALLIRDYLLSAALEPGEKVVLVGYSKGTPDILEALVNHPEIIPRVAAVVSVAGAVGGSPMADELSEFYVSIMMNFPAPHCPAGDGGGIESLRPRTRHLWLSKHPLPDGIRFYSLANFAGREEISAILQPKYDKLARIDPRNDGSVLFFDMVIPGSNLLGYARADHAAIAMPINRKWPNLSSGILDRNAFPREVLLEAVTRFVEEDLLDAH
jgi:pimeloyl-ACP methyl ester carboxylesterase